jgi:type I restriction enzyme S subunit
MTSEWPLVPLDELTDGTAITYGVVKPGDECENGVLFIRGGDVVAGRIQTEQLRTITRDVSAQYSRTLLRGGELLVSLVGNPGEVAIVPAFLAGANIARQIGLIRIDASKADPNYVQFFFRSKTGRDLLLAHSKGSVQQVINLKDLKSVSLPLPPLANQRSIACFMQTLDDRITLLRETNATLEAIAQALFKSWFVDFDPVCAKMAGRAPEGMDEATAALFPDALEETELGVVPKGWRVGKVSELGHVVCGKTPPTSCAENYGGDVPFITIPDMHGLLAVTETARSLSRQGADSQAKKYLPAGAVCVSCIATPGLVVQATTAAQTNQQINSVIPFDLWGEAFPLFLLSRVGGAVRVAGSGGSVFHNLSKSGFEAISVLLPSSALARAFNNYAEPVIHRIVENQRQVKVLSDLRATLLPRLISGQLSPHEPPYYKNEQ